MFDSIFKSTANKPVTYQSINSDLTTGPPEILISYTNKTNEMEKSKIHLELYTKLNTGPIEKFDKILRIYDDEVVLDMIVSYINEPVIKSNLRNIFPLTKSPIIFKFIKANIPVHIIEQVADRININCLNKDKRTCLYYVTRGGYLLELLSSNKLNFDINYIDPHSHTFLRNFFLCDKNAYENGQIEKIMKIMMERKYNFNQLCNGMSLLDTVCVCKHISARNNIMSIPECDITLTILWIYALIHDNPVRHIGSASIHIIPNRSDYESFLNKIISKYARSYATADQDIVLIMSMLQLCNNEKLIQMINYKNTEGNTVAHIAAIYHLDRVLRFIKLDPNTKYEFDKNLDGKSIKDLYMENDMSNIFG